MEDKKLGHIVELDGLRGIAVLLVMFYHFAHVPEVTNKWFDQAYNNIMLGGWVGVDLFFVLSGFLITRILINTRNKKFYFKSFYVKRVLRIFPLYYLYLILSFFIILPYMYGVMQGPEQHKILVAQESQLWFWLYLSNIKQIINGVFFGAGVGHLWSLSIEEQFYIIWPLIIYFLPMRSLKNVCISIITGALVIRIIWAILKPDDAQFIYVFTFTRIDTLAIGSLIAILFDQGYQFKYKSIKISLLLFFLLSLFIVYFFGPRAERNPIIYTIGFSVLAISFGLIIVLLRSGHKFALRTLFSNKILVFLGKYSYALYIFHPLVRQLLMKFMGNPKVIMGTQIPYEIVFTITGCIVTTGIALLSWHLYEKWFLKLKNRVSFIPVKAEKTVSS